MGKKPTKAADNVYCITRMKAAKCNDKLNSMEGAAEISGIDRTRLARIELGSITPYPEEAQMLADIYNAPELNNWYCANQCPIGRVTVSQIEIEEIAQITVSLVAALNKTNYIKDELVDIVDDKVISDHEVPALNQIMESLDKIQRQTSSLKLWVQKNLQTRGRNE